MRVLLFDDCQKVVKTWSMNRVLSALPKTSQKSSLSKIAVIMEALAKEQAQQYFSNVNIKYKSDKIIWQDFFNTKFHFSFHYIYIRIKPDQNFCRLYLTQRHLHMLVKMDEKRFRPCTIEVLFGQAIDYSNISNKADTFTPKLHFTFWQMSENFFFLLYLECPIHLKRTSNIWP